VGDRPGRSTGALHRFLESRLRPVSTLVLLLVVSSAVAVGFLPGSGTAPPPSEFGYFVEDFTVTTIEGVAKGDQLHAVQQAFIDCGGTQCGICTPGMVLAAVNLLERCPNPTEADVRAGLAGNLCRCTGYIRIFESVLRALQNQEPQRHRG